MKSAAIFIHSRYPKNNLGFYKELCRRKFKIAVDGGYNFFKIAGIKPDIIIGDFDSLSRKSVKGIKTLSFPAEKDKTDTELAVDYCIEKKFKSIDIVMPAVGEPDHFLGLVSLLAGSSIMKRSARIVNHLCEIKLLQDETLTFRNCRNDKFSIKAACKPIKLTCRGTHYKAENLEIKPWQTRGMRNVIRDKKASITIRGTAIIVHYWGKQDNTGGRK